MGGCGVPSNQKEGGVLGWVKRAVHPKEDGTQKGLCRVLGGSRVRVGQTSRLKGESIQRFGVCLSQCYWCFRRFKMKGRGSFFGRLVSGEWDVKVPCSWSSDACLTLKMIVLGNQPIPDSLPSENLFNH